MKDNTILIIPNNNKDLLIEAIRSKYPLVNIKFMTFDELIKELYFDYKDDTIIYLMTKYNINYNIAKIYLKNIYYLNNSNYNKQKLIFLNDIKNDLSNHNFLIYNPLFKDYITNYNIIIYGFDYLTKREENIIKDLKKITNVTIEQNNDNLYDHKYLYMLDNLNSEVDYVANEIISLTNNNISINNIKLVVPDDYILTIERIFKLYNIPLISNKTSLYETKIGLNLLNNLSNIEEYLNTINNPKIAKKILNILNQYSSYNLIEIKDVIKEELKNTYISNNKLTNYIELIDLKHYNFIKDKYIFILGFNQQYIPKITKNEDYLEDNLKQLLNLDTSNDLNKQERLFLINKIKIIKNLTITCNKELIISSLINDLNLEIKAIDNNNYSNSNIMNKLKLSMMLDNYYKYGTITNDLDYLYYNYNDLKYKKYNNNYTKINNELLLNYLNNKLLLSYTSVDNYLKCSFKYYLANVLKLKKEEDTFNLFIGSLFHYILSICFNDNFNFEEEYNNYITNNRVVTDKENYFLTKLKKELLNIINTIKEQYTLSTYNNYLYEDKIYVNIPHNKLNVTFMGVIDKVIIKEDKTIKKIAIIDYKTGNVDINLDNIKYGLNLQLPIYIYLAKRSDKLNNSLIVGFYLQKILSKDLKLIGYSTDNISILEEFDSSYQNSQMIKSLKTTKEGFSSYSKLFNENILTDIDNTINNKINDTTNNIIEANFNINPKRLDNINISCNYCKYKDICYMKEENIIDIKK